MKPEDLAYFEQMLQECIHKEVSFELSLEVKWALTQQRKIGERPVRRPSGEEELGTCVVEDGEGGGGGNRCIQRDQQ